MKNLRFIILFSVFWLGISCSEKKDLNVENQLVSIKSKFKNKALFKKIEIAEFQTKVLVYIKAEKKFQEWELRHKNWKELRDFHFETKGNVDLEDFLFSLNDSIEKNLMHKIDSLPKPLKNVTLNANEVFDSVQIIHSQIIYIEAKKLKELQFVL